MMLLMDVYALSSRHPHGMNQCISFLRTEELMNPISKIQLGQTKLQVTRLGVGGAALGGLFEDPTEDEASGTVNRALQLGINLLDTAPLYGAGKSESRLGRALSGKRRDCFVMSTKAGYDLVPEEKGAKD